MRIAKTPQELILAIRAHGLTQAEVASRTGITQSTISKIERIDDRELRSGNYLALLALHDELAKSASRKAGKRKSVA